MAKDNRIETKFHFFDLNLTAYKEMGQIGANSMLKKIFQCIIENLQNSKVYIKDRRENIVDVESRNLLIFALSFFDKGTKAKGKIAVLRDKLPIFLEADHINVSEIENVKNGKLAEVTHFVVDFRNHKPFVMFEYNYNGPRISDFEYYIRQYGKEIDIAKYCNSSIRVKGEIDSILNNLINVGEIELKVRPEKSTFLKNVDNTYYSTIQTLNKLHPFQTIKLSTGFSRVKKNIGGLDLARNILTYFNKNTSRLDEIDDLKMTIDRGNGFEPYDLIKEKESVNLYVDPSSPGRPNSKQLYAQATVAIEKFV